MRERCRYRCATPHVYLCGLAAGYRVLSKSIRLDERIVDALSQRLAGFEVRDVFPGQIHRIPGFGISAGTRRAKMERKTSKAANLDPFAGGKCAAHLLKQAPYRELYIPVRKVTLLVRNFFY